MKTKETVSANVTLNNVVALKESIKLLLKEHYNDDYINTFEKENNLVDKKGI